MIRFIFKSQKGQTSIEYILLIACAVSFGLVFMKKMNEYVIKNPNGIIGGPLSKFTNAMQKDPTGRYRVYSLPTSSRRPSGN